jgi:hypothetical protein
VALSGPFGNSTQQNQLVGGVEVKATPRSDDLTP